MIQNMKKIVPVVTLFISVGSLHAQDTTPIQLSLIPDIALYPSTTMVKGLSLNIWGQNPQEGFTLGFVNGSTGDSAGLSVGLINYDENYAGVQWGAFNVSTESFYGWQNGFINVAQGTFVGFQLGFVNVSEDTKGVQFGWINYAQSLNGIQAGLINMAMNNPPFHDFPDKLSPVFPIVNWSF